MYVTNITVQQSCNCHLFLEHIAAGPGLFGYTPKKFIMPSKAGKESFLGQILLSDLRLYSFELKKQNPTNLQTM